ncbi:MAG: class I SAM-dependent methyltransferase [Salinirussus sp.]
MSLRWQLLRPFYDRLMAPLAPVRRHVIRAAVRDKDRVLLIGCGTGQTLQALPPEATVVAIDQSAAMVTRTRRAAAERGMTIDGRVGDAADTELPADAFDVACLHLVLSIADRPATLLDEAIRVLRPDGRLSILADRTVVNDLEALLDAAGAGVDHRMDTPHGCEGVIARPSGDPP